MNFLGRIQRLLANPSLNQEIDVVPSEVVEYDRCYNLIGASDAMKKVYDQIRRFAKREVDVFVYGETGTGKELTAEAIFQLSHRSGKPYVPIDCGGLSETLIDSELFGHEKGAFTGAIDQKKGLLEHAHTGTVFLDEITELRLDLQSKLLRFLEKKHMRRIGGVEYLDLDFRVIAATNRDPWQAIKEKTLREDLFYRLNGLLIHLPPLREREGDLEMLSSYFLKQTAVRMGETCKSLTPDSLEVLQNYPWPGNVRELYKLMEQLHIVTDDKIIDVVNLPDHIRKSEKQKEELVDYSLPYKKAEEQCLRNLRKSYFKRLLKMNDGSITITAQMAGVDRATIYRWMKEEKKQP